MIESTKLIKMNILFLVFLGGRGSEKEYFLYGSNIDKNREPLFRLHTQVALHDIWVKKSKSSSFSISDVYYEISRDFVFY